MAVAQMPKECFFLTKMHGPEGSIDPEVYGDTALISNLPWLMQHFKPGMYIKSVDGHSLMDDDFEKDHLDGLRLHLTDGSTKSQPPMGLIGSSMPDEPEAFKKILHYSKNDQPTSISLLFDNYSICDIILRRANGKEESLSPDNADCMLELDEITERNYALPKETPLVGFHSISEEEGMDSLGLILFDSMDKQCQTPLKYNPLETLDQKHEFVLDAYVEKNITEQEKARADALEAILSFKNIKDARKKQKSLKSQILALNREQPIDIEDQFNVDIPSNVEEMAYFADRLDRLVSDEEQGKKDVTIAELRTMFLQLAIHYDEVGEEAYEMDEELLEDMLPFTVGDLKKIYKSLAEIDGWKVDSRTYSGDPSQPAGTLELSNLFE